MNSDLSIDAKKECQNIISFINEVIKKTKKSHLVIACSGGIDSSVSLSLVHEAVGPQNISVLSLPYGGLHTKSLELTKKLISYHTIPKENFYIDEITRAVDICATEMGLAEEDIIRRGNIMARIRMVYLFDMAKKMNGLVIGTENRSEYYLGYFTRFGDEASDVEPIQHLYKTQIYMLARELGVPEEIIQAKPSAGLWEHQTDEDQLGFTYEEADQVLSLHFDKHIPFEDISEEQFPSRDLISKTVSENAFKHHVPYLVKSK